MRNSRNEEIESTHITNVGTFFGLHCLFNIPFIGFIAAIVFAFAGTNITRKNYARARLIWQLIRTLCFILMVLGTILVLRFFSGDISGFITDYVADIIGDIF